MPAEVTYRSQAPEGLLTSDSDFALLPDHHVNLQNSFSDGFLNPRACGTQPSLSSQTASGKLTRVRFSWVGLNLIHIFLQIQQSTAKPLLFPSVDLPLSGRIFSFPVILMPIPLCTKRGKESTDVIVEGDRAQIDSVNTEEHVFPHLGSAAC